MTSILDIIAALCYDIFNGDASFTGFYHLCRCLLVKSEADFDAFDRTFLEPHPNALGGQAGVSKNRHAVGAHPIAAPVVLLVLLRHAVCW